jgi:hypothetical protein
MSAPAKSDEAPIGAALIHDRVDILIFALGALAVLIAAFSYGRNAQATAEGNLKATIEEENHSFCTGLGFDPANSLYQKCCNGAAVIRSREEERMRRSLGAI